MMQRGFDTILFTPVEDWCGIVVTWLSADIAREFAEWLIGEKIKTYETIKYVNITKDTKPSEKLPNMGRNTPFDNYQGRYMGGGYTDSLLISRDDGVKFVLRWADVITFQDIEELRKRAEK